MKTAPVEMTEDMAEQFLSILEARRDDYRSKANSLQKQIEQIQTTFGLGGISVVDSPHEVAMHVAGPLRKTPSGRTKKGQSEKFITDYLKVNNGSGATIKEITAATGTSYGTARRVLRRLHEYHSVNVAHGFWKWAK